MDARTLAGEVSANLRGWDGLTPASLSNCPTVLSALRTTDPTAGVQRLQDVLAKMPRDKWQAALANALRVSGEGPETLAARRKIFATLSSVSEETVKSWEGRAIEALAATLAAETSEHVRGLRLLYEVEDSRLKLQFESRLMESADGTFRVLSRHREGVGALRMRMAAYQLQADEPVEQLDMILVFPASQQPSQVYRINEAADLWDLTSGSFRYGLVRAADLARDVLADLPPSERARWAESMRDAVTYSAGWEEPTVGRIYGFFWTS